MAAEARLRYFEPSSAGEAAKDWRWGEEGTFTSGGSSPEVIRSSPRNGTDGILEGYLKEEELSLDKVSFLVGRRSFNAASLFLRGMVLCLYQNRYLGTGSGLHLAKSISDFASTTSPKTYVFEVQTMQLSLVERLILEEQRRSTFMYELPPDDLGKALVEAFFSRVNPNMGLLHRPSFDRAIRDGSLQRNASFRNLCMSHPDGVSQLQISVTYSDGG